jgi:endonuclease/exonuclease/phosphatase (EEP) superfamily protein YafD
VWLLPLIGLALASLAGGRRAWLPVGLALVVVVGPVMGLCLPWPTLVRQSAKGSTFHILTCNVHGRQLEPSALAELLTTTNRDIIVLQELRPEQLPVLFSRGEWHIRHGQRLCLASRFPILQGEFCNSPDFVPKLGLLARYELDTPAGRVNVANLHLASPRYGLVEVIDQRGGPAPELEANSELRGRQSAEATEWLATCRGPLLIAGDFNTPVESCIYREFWGRYTNAFSAAGFGFGNTHFTRYTAVRIDHILAGPGWQWRRCWIGPRVGSPHRPLLADVEWVGGPVDEGLR